MTLSRSTIVWSVAVAVIALLMLGWSLFPSKEQMFERISNLPLLTSSVVEISETASGPMDSDGMRCFEVAIDNPTFIKWRQLAPLACNRTWKSGPVTEAYVMRGAKYPPSAEYESATNFYATCISDDEGQLIIVNPKQSRAWLLYWW